MKILFNRERFKFYVVVGLVYLLLWIFNALAKYPEDFVLRSLNEIWRTTYIVALNYLLFEYIIPQLSWRRILRSVFLLAIQIFLMSLGLYIWRALGIQLRVYTVFKEFSSVGAGVSAQMEASMGSLFFFGIIRHIYDHIKLKQTAQQLRIEKQEAELNYLKSQTNPHFLFNTLNNIYSLARDKSDLAAESILRPVKDPSIHAI
jgi:two-component system, LytTR family, sensor kinase